MYAFLIPRKFPIYVIALYDLGFCVFIFGMFALALLPMDIKADSKYIYISKWFRKYKIFYSEISLVTMYFNGVPMMDITKTDGKVITQSLSMLNDKNTSILFDILKEQNVKVSDYKLEK